MPNSSADSVPASQIRAVVRSLLIIGCRRGRPRRVDLYRLASVVLVLILAALFAYVIAPLVQLAEHSIRIAGRPRRLSRGAAIALVYVLMAGGVSGGRTPAAQRDRAGDDMISRAPAYTQSILAWEHDWTR